METKVITSFVKEGRMEEKVVTFFAKAARMEAKVVSFPQGKPGWGKGRHLSRKGRQDRRKGRHLSRPGTRDGHHPGNEGWNPEWRDEEGGVPEGMPPKLLRLAAGYAVRRSSGCTSSSSTDQLRDPLLFHGDAVEAGGDFHGELVVSDDDELGVLRHLLEEVDEAGGVDVVERRVDLVDLLEGGHEALAGGLVDLLDGPLTGASTSPRPLRRPAGPPTPASSSSSTRTAPAPRWKSGSTT